MCSGRTSSNGETHRLAQDVIEGRKLDFITVVGKIEPALTFEVMGRAGSLTEAQRESCALFAEELVAYRRD
jgi:adenylate cyclase